MSSPTKRLSETRLYLTPAKSIERPSFSLSSLATNLVWSPLLVFWNMYPLVANPSGLSLRLLASFSTFFLKSSFQAHSLQIALLQLCWVLFSACFLLCRLLWRPSLQIFKFLESFSKVNYKFILIDLHNLIKYFL